MVCLGNICRSPTAHGVFQKLITDAGLDEYINVDSAGTGEWHIGGSPDARATQTAAQRGYNLSPLRARQVSSADFNQFDYILAMDEQNLADLQAMCPADYNGDLNLFLHYAYPNTGQTVPDPYYGGDQGFEDVLDLVEQGASALLNDIKTRHGLA